MFLLFFVFLKLVFLSVLIGFIKPTKKEKK